ncbi:helicase-related protein, partial [Methylacidiphilum caldifontis]|uniref:helicase-related protein n=1 Tax=Methylacidiphilum caldifontis TaxID=2795386 RepID=UPI001ABC0CC2
HSPGLTGTLRRVIAFVNSVKGSQTLAETFRERARRQPDADAPLTYAIDHIDGTMTMAERSRLLRRLEDPADGTGYVLTNARVLTEGIDVPALDAVVFLEPRKSQVDVIQAVGRVMRRPEDRPDKIGYIVIPVVVDEGTSETLGAVEQVLLPQDQRFRPLIQIINALRSLDETLDVKIRHLMSHDGLPEKEDATIRFVFDPIMPTDLQEAVQRAIRPRLVEPVDNRHYFAAFAETITQVTEYPRT